MKRLVYSMIPACSNAGTINETIECERCGMRLPASNMKMYIDDTLAAPVDYKLDKEEIYPGIEGTFEVTYDKEVKDEEVTVKVGSQLVLVSKTVADKKAVIKFKTVDEPVLLTQMVTVTCNGVNRIAEVKVVNTPDPKAPVLKVEKVEMNKTVLQVGDTSTVRVYLKEEVPAGE